jgi:hypothetical protein
LCERIPAQCRAADGDKGVNRTNRISTVDAQGGKLSPKGFGTTIGD